MGSKSVYFMGTHKFLQDRNVTCSKNKQNKSNIKMNIKYVLFIPQKLYQVSIIMIVFHNWCYLQQQQIYIFIF